MEYKYFIKYGAKVRWTWRDYNFYAAICKGYGPIPYEEKEEIVTIVGTPRDNNFKQFVSLETWFDDEEVEVKIRRENGSETYAPLNELSVYAEIGDLTFEELKTLRSEISVGSCYLADYDNSFGVDRNVVSSICDGYLEWLDECFGEELADENDTPENFAHYIAD